MAWEDMDLTDDYQKWGGRSSREQWIRDMQTMGYRLSEADANIWADLEDKYQQTLSPTMQWKSPADAQTFLGLLDKYDPNRGFDTDLGSRLLQAAPFALAGAGATGLLGTGATTFGGAATGGAAGAAGAGSESAALFANSPLNVANSSLYSGLPAVAPEAAGGLAAMSGAAPVSGGAFGASLGTPFATGAAAPPSWATPTAAGAGEAAAPAGAGTSATAATGGTPLGRLLGLEQTGQDLLSVGGALLPGVLGYLGADKQSDAYRDVADKYFNVGAPYRSTLEQSYKPGFDLAAQPGYGDAFNRMADISARSYSSKFGNPAGSPSAQAGILGDVWNQSYLPALSNYRGQLGQFGGLGLNTSGAASLGGAGVAGGGLDAIGYGLGTAMNQQPNWNDIFRNLGTGTNYSTNVMGNRLR